MKAKKKPVIIDFFPINDIDLQLSEIQDWVKSFGDNFSDKFHMPQDKKLSELYVLTLEGTSYTITNSDVIIRGVQGEYYPCKKDIFEQTYDVL